MNYTWNVKKKNVERSTNLPVWPLFLRIVWFGNKFEPSNISGGNLTCFTDNEFISMGLWYLPKQVLYCSPQWLGPRIELISRNDCLDNLMKIKKFKFYFANLLILHSQSPDRWFVSPLKWKKKNKSCFTFFVC